MATKHVWAPTVLFSLALFSATAFGDDCGPTVDLRASGASVGDHPVISQGFGDTNTCGFFAASWLIDAYRKKFQIGLDHRGELAGFTQPIGTATEMAIERGVPSWFPIQMSTDPLSNIPGRSGSIACDIIHYARESGVCVDESEWSRDLATSGHLSDKVAKIYATLERYAARSSRRRATSLEEVSSAVFSDFTSLEPKPKSDETATRESVRALIAENETHPYAVISGLFFGKCGRSHLALDSLPKCRSRYYVGLDMFGLKNARPKRVGKIRRRVESLLGSADPLPILINYCSDLLWAGRKGVAKSPIGDDCGMHWSLIIGKRRSAGACQYLVRNSYHPDLPYSKDWDQDGNDVWIGAEELARSIFTLSWLDES
jgi:hypothetical protein